MKSTILFYCLLFLTLHSSAQWTPTNLGGSKAITTHKGKVYALTSAQGLQVSADNGDTWTIVNTDTIVHRKDHLVSCGDRLYIGTYDIFTANGNVYYSEDEGLTWLTDTVGLPDAAFQSSGKMDVHTLVSYGDGELIGTFGGIDAYYHKNISDSEWEIIPELASLDPDDYVGSEDKIIAFGSSPTIKVSTDNAHTFTDVIATGLPSYFVPTGVYWDRGDRFFLGVNAPILNKTQFYFSDDEGVSWDSLNIAQFVGVDFTSSRQKLTAVFGLDDNVYFALYNDQSNTTADIYSSTDAGVTFSKDTTGLTVDGFSTEFVTMFLYNDQRLFSVHSNTDAHHTGLVGPVAGIVESETTPLALYPNPTSKFVNFSAPVTNVRVYSLQGSLLLFTKSQLQSLDFTNYQSGIYLIECLDQQENQQILKLIVE